MMTITTGRPETNKEKVTLKTIKWTESDDLKLRKVITTIDDARYKANLDNNEVESKYYQELSDWLINLKKS